MFLPSNHPWQSSSAVPSGRTLFFLSPIPGDESPGYFQMCLQHISPLLRDVAGGECSLLIVMLSPHDVPEGSPAIAGRLNFRNFRFPSVSSNVLKGRGIIAGPFKARNPRAIENCLTRPEGTPSFRRTPESRLDPGFRPFALSLGFLVMSSPRGTERFDHSLPCCSVFRMCNV